MQHHHRQSIIIITIMLPSPCREGGGERELPEYLKSLPESRNIITIICSTIIIIIIIIIITIITIMLPSPCREGGGERELPEYLKSLPESRKPQEAFQSSLEAAEVHDRVSPTSRLELNLELDLKSDQLQA
jgi:hypothetical protein